MGKREYISCVEWRVRKLSNDAVSSGYQNAVIGSLRIHNDASKQKNYPLPVRESDREVTLTSPVTIIHSEVGAAGGRGAASISKRASFGPLILLQRFVRRFHFQEAAQRFPHLPLPLSFGSCTPICMRSDLPFCLFLYLVNPALQLVPAGIPHLPLPAPSRSRTRT